ncbi:restriction endonuclease subunit S [Treponema vincentii]|uniref:restriction endonuclease subunit S n=1 Tax=Treponema vincentii TaxID=69710 RepID=UPI003D8CA411
MREWKKVRIGEFLTERQGRYKPNDNAIATYKRLDKIDFSGTIHISEKPSKTDMIVVQPGDLVISGINVAKGAITVYQGTEPVTATIHYSSYIFDDSVIDFEYFKYFVKSPAFIETLKKQVKGGIKTEIKSKVFLPLEISLPDLPTQKQIVKRISVNLKRVNKLAKEIETQKRYAKQLRRNILQDAIEGKLTADWRKEHPVRKGNPDYDAEALFELIQKERKVDKKRKALPPILDAEKPFELPAGWKWVRLGDVISIETHIVNSSDYLDSIQIAPDDIEKGTGELLENLRTVREKGVISVNHLFSKDALLYSKIRPRLRKIIYVDFEGLCSADMYPLNTKMNKHFIKYLMLSDYFDVEVYKFDNRVKMPKINQSQLSSIKIPIVPLAEQNKIAEKIETVFTKYKQLEHEVSQCKRYINQIMQGVLKNAFGDNAK